MDNAELYAVYNSMQRRATEKVLDEFSPRFSWQEKETVLDIGCGPGDVTAEVLFPQLPLTSSLVGVDISPEMVKYANEKHSNNNVRFEVLDFGTKKISQVLTIEQFSKIFSFYCLHWIHDQKQVAQNIKTLLQPGGEFLILVAPKNQAFLVYKILSQMDKWKGYMQNVQKFIPCYNDSPDPCGTITQVFTEEGLEVICCEERKESVTFPSKKILLKSNEAVNPFVKRMSQETREQYMASFERVIEEQQMYSEIESGEVETANPIIIVYGRRPL